MNQGQGQDDRLSGRAFAFSPARSDTHVGFNHRKALPLTHQTVWHVGDTSPI
jgi:hypothetical protein